jgi:hypothetical protein
MFDENRTEDWAEKVMNQFDRMCVLFFKIGIPCLIGIGLGYAWRMVQGG